MSLFQLVGVVGCLLAAVHAAFSFPVIVKIANNQLPALPGRNMHLWSGLMMYSCWGLYGFMSGNYLLAFALLLGILKYGVVLIQSTLNIANK